MQTKKGFAKQANPFFVEHLFALRPGFVFYGSRKPMTIR